MYAWLLIMCGYSLFLTIWAIIVASQASVSPTKAFDYGYASSDGLQQLNFEMKGVARNHLALEFYAVDLHEIGRVVLRIRNTA